MADDSTKLTAEQRAHAVNWIKEHWVGAKECPISGHNDWDIGGYVVQPITHQPMGKLNLMGGPSFPCVLMICNQCGYTMQFNAVIMGLFPKKKEQGEEAKAQEQSQEAPNVEG